MMTTNRIKQLLAALTLIGCHLSFCGTPCTAQTSTTAYQPGVTPEGAVYFLPKTAVNVTLEIVKTAYTPGEFSKYADRYLRLKNVVQEPSVSYQVAAVTLSPVALPDTKKGYSVKYNAKTSACNVELSDEGMLLAINTEPVATPSANEPKTTSLASAARSGRPDLASVQQYLSEEIMTAGSTAKTAQLIAQEIYDLRENKNLLIKGQADFMPKDGEQLRLMLAQIDQQNEALSSLFAGSTQNDTTYQTIVFCPDSAVNRQLLFRFSERLGPVDIDDMAGSPYYIIIEDLKTVPTADAQGTAKKKLNENGIYVNVPGKMRATVQKGNQPLAVAELPAPQFGNVELLSGELFNKRYTTHLTLNPITGAVEKLEAEQPKK